MSQLHLKINPVTPCRSCPLPDSYQLLRRVVGLRGGELEVDTLAGQTLVDLRVGVETVVNTTTLLLVEDDLEDLGAVLLGAHALTDDLDGVDEVGKDGVVNGSQSARSWALLGLGGAAAVAALWAWQNAARGDDEDVAVGELLLELTGEAADFFCQYKGPATSSG